MFINTYDVNGVGSHRKNLNRHHAFEELTVYWSFFDSYIMGQQKKCVRTRMKDKLLGNQRRDHEAMSKCSVYMKQ